MNFDPTRLTQLGDRRAQLQAELEALRGPLVDEIRRAHAAGMPQVEIVRLSHYTRDRVSIFTAGPGPRRRGRPPGSKNRPKAPAAAAASVDPAPPTASFESQEKSRPAAVTPARRRRRTAENDTGGIG